MSETPRPGVGIGLFVLNSNNEILLGLRQGSNGAGTYGLAGGHLEFGEEFETCASRELFEETGLHVPHDDIRFLTAINVADLEGKHFVTIFMGCRLAGLDGKQQVPKVTEPEKCKGWNWYSWEQMRTASRNEARGIEGAVQPSKAGMKLFKPLNRLIEQQPNFDPDVELKRLDM